jgi:hypothetical protein
MFKLALARTLRTTILALTVAVGLATAAPRAHAGDYSGKVVNFLTITNNGTSYTIFQNSDGAYNWAIPSYLSNAKEMIAVVEAGYITQRTLRVGCQSCRSFTLTGYPLSGTWTVWIPDYVWMLYKDR